MGTDITPTGMGQKEVYNFMSRLIGLGFEGVVAGDPNCKEGYVTTTSVRMDGRIYYVINGVRYSAKGVEAVLANGTDNITTGGFGAWRIMIDATGTLTTVAAVAAGGDMNFTVAEDALMNLASQAPTASAVDVGYLVIEAAGGGFTIGTDLPVTSDAAVTSATYYSVGAVVDDNGLTAPMSLSLGVGTTPEQYSHGTVNARTNGQTVAQIAAGATVAFDDADTIGTAVQFGGHLIITDLAGTGLYALAANGVAGAVSAMTFATAALANTDLDTVETRLPMLFTVIGRIVVASAKAPFAYITDDINGTDGTATFTSKGVEVPRLTFQDLS
ncbi:MAG: hypothetical protein CEE38_23615 [Planctomycetes bacterium B3_Pla]|nr:MAG: hypothetical protein CEE38_23615 [Planctomycetes bacterium B3_Pla]